MEAVDTVVLDASGDVNFDEVADFLTEEGLGDGGIDGNLVLLEVHLVGTDDGEGLYDIGVEIGHLDTGEKANGVGTESVGVDDLGETEHLLEETDTADEAGLGSLGGVVFKVFAQVALVAGFDEGFLYLGVFDGNELLQFGLNLVIAFFGHVFHIRRNEGRTERGMHRWRLIRTRSSRCWDDRTNGPGRSRPGHLPREHRKECAEPSA